MISSKITGKNRIYQVRNDPTTGKKWIGESKKTKKKLSECWTGIENKKIHRIEIDSWPFGGLKKSKVLFISKVAENVLRIKKIYTSKTKNRSS